MNEGPVTPARVAIVGAGGLVGRAVVDHLRAMGRAVGAIPSTSMSRARLSEIDASVLDIEPSDPVDVWIRELADVDAVIHAGLPRLSAPVRSRRLAKTIPHALGIADRLIASLPDGAALVLASSQFVAPQRRIARVAAAVEDRLRECPRLRVVRLPWVFGGTGPMAWITRGLETRRFRVVGPGDNRLPMISANDAARACAIALDLPPGTYEAGQPDPPTQLEVVAHLCSAGAIPRPDHVPPWLAVFTLGGPLADAFAYDLPSPISPELIDAGWTPRDDWERDLLRLTRRPEAPEVE